MDESQALTIKAASDLRRSGEVADHYASLWVFEEYHQTCTPNTRRRQHNDLALYSAYLAAMGVARSPDDLFSDAEAWEGMTYGHVKGFRRWLLEKGYAIGSVNVSMATIRRYCALAREAGVLDAATLDLIKTVKSYSHKDGRNIDADRTKAGQGTRKGLKKATPAHVTTGAARRLKKATIAPETSRSREHDKLLAARDTLLMCLLIEHALRVSEIVALDVENFNLDEATITVYRRKTDRTDTYKLMDKTFHAAATYLAKLGRTSGPLFASYQGKRITTRAINDRVGELGRQVGIAGLSPHDLRHHWTMDALKHGTPLDVIQAYGGWSSPAMLLHYARVTGKVHDGLKISE